MKKVFLFLFSLCLAFTAFSQQKNAVQKLQVIDKSVNPVRQWRVYAFEAIGTDKMDLKALGNDLKAVKGFKELQESSVNTQHTRFVIYVAMDMILAKSPDVLQVFRKHNLEITNIPTEVK
ncbi:MAG: hypothetical protein RJA07_2399 [Bacteroidota bacterium]|jgi:hypothetical protein